jgi:hypothetical protein
MTTLIIHAPREKVEQEGKRSFSQTMRSGIGDAYAIPSDKAHRLRRGDKVVVLSKDERRRAEGYLVDLLPNGRTKTGMQRYDVHIRDLEEVSYKPEPLGRTGVAVV